MAPPTQRLPPPDEPTGGPDTGEDEATTVELPGGTSLPPSGTGSTDVHMATVVGRLLRTRGVYLYFAIVALGALLLIFTVRQAAIILPSPTSGVDLGKSGLVRSVDERWSTVEHRDVVVAVNGDPVPAPPAALPMLLAVKPGPVVLRLARDGREFEAAAHTEPRGTTEQAAIVFRVLIGALMLLSGALAFLLRPGLRASWLAVLVAHAAGAFVLDEIAFHDAHPVLGGRLQAVMIALTSSLGIHFFCEFPTTVSWIRQSPHRSAWFYLPSAFLVAPFLGTFPDLAHAVVWELSGIAIRVWLIVSALIIVGLLTHQYRLAKQSSDGRALPQCRALIAGVALGFVLPALWNVIRLAFGIGFSPAHAHFNTAPTIILMVMTLYAYVRHNPMAVDRFTAAVVGYTGTLVVLVVLFAAILVGLPLLLGQEMMHSPTAIVVVTVIVVLTFTPVYRALKRTVDRWFFRDPVDLGRAVQLLQDLKRARHDAPRDQALRSALEAATALRTDRAQLWTLTDDGG
ncbi:MAG: hypothetical protein JRI23_26210, partial [Deltaproteobacteria bacterium]|nr:hypothetical protein [Deltaproteobacteria bacterium]MBW2535527.1 hypothetical protein [Deltaproteobacteria bacterium]